MASLRGRIILATLITIALISAPAQAEQRQFKLAVQKQGNTTNVDIIGPGSYVSVIADIRRLRASSAPSLTIIEKQRDALPPPFYLEAARQTCQLTRSKAQDWITLFQLRAAYDARRCQDPSAVAKIAETAVVLRAEECANLSGDDVERKASFRRVIAEDKIFSSTASPWWICSGGLQVLTWALKQGEKAEAGEVLTIDDSQWLRPEAEWPAIEEKMRAELADAFGQ